jgi:hypothetical protein
MNKNNPELKYTLNDCGCYVDGARGIYVAERVIYLANEHGADLSLTDKSKDVEYIWELEDEATNYMNEKFAVDGAYWGRTENGDWGLWATEMDASKRDHGNKAMAHLGYRFDWAIVTEAIAAAEGR